MCIIYACSQDFPLYRLFHIEKLDTYIHTYHQLSAWKQAPRLPLFSISRHPNKAYGLLTSGVFPKQSPLWPVNLQRYQPTNIRIIYLHKYLEISIVLLYTLQSITYAIYTYI